MSRSFRKKPILKDHGCEKFGKKQASKKVRRVLKLDIVGNGSNYKKHFCSYDIHDYVCYINLKGDLFLPLHKIVRK